MDNSVAVRSVALASDRASEKVAVTRSSAKDRLVGLDWLRGVAALWVFVYHFNVTIQKPKYFAAESMGPLAELGYHGVDLFFVLSGFVMAASTPTAARNDLSGMRNFFIRRIMRVFPAYIAVTVPLMMVAVLTGIGAPDSTPLDARLVVSNLLLLPRDDLTSFVPVVAWTLTHELMFYLLFSLTFVSRRLALSALVVWSVLSIATYVMGGPPSGWVMQLSVLNVYFLAGVLTYHLSARFGGRRWVAGAASLAFLGAAGWLESTTALAGTSRTVLQAICYGAAFTLMIFAVARLAGRTGLAARALDALGRQSYSIYLVHYPIIVIVAMLLATARSPALGPLAFLLSLAGTLAASLIIYRLIEQPAIAWGRRLTARTRGD